MLRKGASERDLYRMCTKTFTWRLLTGPELTAVYLNEMRRDFPAGELSGSCVLIQKAEITQEGNNVVLTLTLDTDRLSEDPLGNGDGYFQFTAGTGCTGVADNGPYFRLQLRITNPLFDD